MRSTTNTTTLCRLVLVVASVGAAAGCASHKVEIAQQSISSQAPFSRTFRGSGDAVCWGVKRALLSQGYMLDRPNESGVLTGTRDFQPDPKLNVSYHLQTTCADNRDGSSIVFVTAEREDSRLQKMKHTTSVGVGPATLTMPSGSAQALGVARRETVKDPAFYDRFFSLLQTYVDQEQRAVQVRRSQDERHAEARNDAQDRNDR